MHGRRILGALALALLAIVPATASAASLQPIGTFEEPIYVTSDPEGAERLFVVERQGEVIEERGGVASVFADLRSKVGCDGKCEGERGLLSVALAPDFDSSGRVFVDYAQSQDGTIHVAELTAGLTGAPLSSYREVLAIPHGGASNHNGGQLQFGPEGFLYISTGDGGGGNDEFHNAQSLGSLLGKILRIDPRPTGVLSYTVPRGNPFPGLPEPYAAIWSYGLRNPFRFSFDRASGAMVIADVGEAEREEIDVAAPGAGGANYGWNCREGKIAGPATDPGCAGAPPGTFAEPVFDYPHTSVEGGPKRCAIIGGYVGHDPGLPELAGRYLYGDRCSGELRSIDLGAPGSSDRSEGLTVPGLDSFGEDSCGRVYAISEDGPVSRLVGAQPTACPLAPAVLSIRPVSRRVTRGRRVVIDAFLSPCPMARRGATVTLRAGSRSAGSRRLSRACTARFTPRLDRRSTFQASIGAGGLYAAELSQKLTIAPLRPRPHRKPAHRRKRGLRDAGARR